MKKLFALAIAVMATINASAQVEEGDWSVTPKFGVNIADMTGKLLDERKAEGTYDATLRPITTFTGGVEFQYGLADQVGLSFGLMYARQGSKTKDDLFRVSMDYFNIPIMVNVYPIRNFGLSVKAGVQVGFLGHKAMKIDGREYNADYTRTLWMNRWGRVVPVYVESELSKQFNKVDFSIPLAVSYELYNFTVEARFNLGLVKAMKDDPEASKHRVWQFTLGYKIPLGDD